MRGVRGLVLAWAAYVVIVWLVAAWAAASLPSRRHPAPPGTAVAGLSAWDGIHYAALAREGYSTVGDARRRLAFFPAFPTLARLFGGRVHAPLAGILLSQVLLLGSLLLLHAWRAPAGRTGLLGEPGFWLLASPLGFFHAVLYAESTFLFLVLLALFLERRGQVRAAAIALFLAGLTRPAALLLPALFLPALFASPRTQRARAALLLAAAPLLGLALHVGAVALATGSLLGYTRIQAELWGHRWTVPFRPTALELGYIVRSIAAGEWPLRAVLLRALLPFGIVALLWATRRTLELRFQLYCLATLLFIHAQIPSLSSARYDLAAFPLYIAFAAIPLARGRSGVAVALAFVLLQLVFLRDFLVWRWVA